MHSTYTSGFHLEYCIWGGDHGNFDIKAAKYNQCNQLTVNREIISYFNLHDFQGGAQNIQGGGSRPLSPPPLNETLHVHWEVDIYNVVYFSVVGHADLTSYIDEGRGNRKYAWWCHVMSSTIVWRGVNFVCSTYLWQYIQTKFEVESSIYSWVMTSTNNWLPIEFVW